MRLCHRNRDMQSYNQPILKAYKRILWWVSYSSPLEGDTDGFVNINVDRICRHIVRVLIPGVRTNSILRIIAASVATSMFTSDLVLPFGRKCARLMYAYPLPQLWEYVSQKVSLGQPRCYAVPNRYVPDHATSSLVVHPPDSWYFTIFCVLCVRLTSLRVSRRYMPWYLVTKLVMRERGS